MTNNPLHNSLEYRLIQSVREIWANQDQNAEDDKGTVKQRIYLHTMVEKLSQDEESDRP